jgi:hypothetical protein
MCKCTSDQTQPPLVATHQLFVPEPRQQSYTKAAPSGLLPRVTGDSELTVAALI